MYLPRGTFKKYFFVEVYDFDVSTTNSAIDLAIIFPNHKSTVHVNLLLSLSNYAVS
jgi:hypothetical protein